MSRFIRLSNMLINVNYIRVIDIKPNEYVINIITDGFNGTFIAGSGVVNCTNKRIHVTKKEHELDFNIVSDWIISEKHNNVWH